MHRHPTLGVKGSKPRLPSTRTNGKPASKTEISRLSREYLEIRNRQMHAKALTAEMVLAQNRDELIEKKLVERQAAYLLINLRQRILNLPQTYARRMVGLKDAAQASKMLRKMAISVLNEIKDLPSKVVDGNWLEKVEEGDV
jgi:hypothetical protein